METTSLRIEGHKVRNSFTLDANGSGILEEITMEETVAGLRTLKAAVIRGDDIDLSYEYTISVETSDPSGVEESHLESKKVLIDNLAVFNMNCFNTSTAFKFSLTGPAEKTGVFVLYY